MSTFYPLSRTAAKAILLPQRGEEHGRDAQSAQVREGGTKALSKKQKAMLAVMARRAAAAKGAPTAGEAHAEWRRDVAVAACGRRISEACQRDWAALKGAFEDEGGRPEQAFETHFRDVDNPRRVAMFKLQEALREKNLPAAYADSICKRQFKCGLGEAAARQLWCLVYTVRNRKKG